MFTIGMVVDDGRRKSVNVKFYFEGKKPSFADIDGSIQAAKALIGEVNGMHLGSDMYEYIYFNDYDPINLMDFFVNHIPKDMSIKWQEENDD